MNVSKFLLCVSLSFAALGFPALAQQEDTVQCPTHQVGTRYEFRRTSDGRSREWFQEVRKVTPDTVEFASNRNGEIITDLVSNSIKTYQGVTFQSKGTSSKYYNLPDCPFKLGEKKEYSGIGFFNGRNQVSGSFTVEVDPQFTTKKVPAGDYKVVKVTSRYSYSSAGAGGTVTVISYYAPELGVVVWYEGTDSYDRSSQVTDLVLYKKP